MLEGIDVLYHSSIKINKGKVIYIDPFKIDENYSDADIIFITHEPRDGLFVNQGTDFLNQGTDFLFIEMNKKSVRLSENKML